MAGEPPGSADGGGRIAADDIPVIDLRVLSQSDLSTLARLSTPSGSPAFSTADLVVPKIDRAVFNESAGSRKQTYARLRLSPASPSAVAGRRRRHHLPPAPPSPPANPSPDPDAAENKRIVDLLRGLLIHPNTAAPAAAAADPHCKNETTQVSAGVSDVFVDYSGDSGAIELKQAVNVVGNVELLNNRGEMVDLVALESTNDLFGEELRKKTIGLQTEAELFEYLGGMAGDWGSRRKKRKIVEADGFGHDLPRGWKLSLGIKRKEGSAMLYCRRFISPNGLQFASCKEVSSYLQLHMENKDGKAPSNGNLETVSQMAASSTPIQPSTAHEVPISHATVPVSPIATNPGNVVLFRIENPVKAQLRNLLECQKCNLTFDSKDKYVQHLSDVHQRNAKRTRLGKSVGDGVIMNGDKFECQFCHKIFDERRRYNGHVGVHVRNLGKSLEEIPDEIIVQTNIDPTMLGVVPAVVVSQIVQPVALPPSGSDEKDDIGLAKALNVNQPIVVFPGADSNNIAQFTNFALVSDNSMNVHHKPNLSQEIFASNATEESCPNIDDCSSAVRAVAALKSMDADSSSAINSGSSREGVDMDIDKIHEILNVEPTSIPTKTELACEMIQNRQDAPCKSSVSDLGCSQNRNDVNFTSFNKELGSRSTENREELIANDTVQPIDMDSDVCLTNAATLVNCQIKEIPRVSFSEMLFGDNIFSYMVGNEEESDKSSLISNVEKIEHEVPHSCDVSNLFKSSIGNEFHSDGKQSASATCRRESSRPVHDGELHENRDIALENYLSMLPDNGRINNFRANFDINVSSAEFETSRKTESENVNEFGNIYRSYNGADVSVTDMIQGVHDRSLLASMIVDNAASLVPSSVCFSNLDGISSKDAEYTKGDEKLAKFPGFELRLSEMEPTKYNFLNVGQPNSLPEESIGLSRGSGLEDGLDLQMQFDWEAATQNMEGPRLLTTVCVWCRIEFSQEGFSLDTENDSVGLICPTCKAKISGQLSGFG